MSDNRSAQRSNVAWRGAIQIAQGRIVPAKITNFSANGLQMLTNSVLKEKQNYLVMLEVPSKRDASQRTQVVCKASCIYSILTGNEYRAGMRYYDLPPQHEALLQEWL